MATDRQIAANKLNAQKSTGPKTPEGKAKSCLNHLSHGLASAATIVPGEDPEEFKALLNDLITEHQPATPTEQILVEKMTIQQWLSLRAFRLQGEAFLNDTVNGAKFAVPKDLGVLIRYLQSSDRAFLRFRTELLNAQKQRKNSEIGFEPQTALSEEENAPKPPTEPAPAPPITPALVPLEDQLEELFNAPLPMSGAEMMEYIRNWQKTGKFA